MQPHRLPKGVQISGLLCRRVSIGEAALVGVAATTSIDLEFVVNPVPALCLFFVYEFEPALLSCAQSASTPSMRSDYFMSVGCGMRGFAAARSLRILDLNGLSLDAEEYV